MPARLTVHLRPVDVPPAGPPAQVGPALHGALLGRLRGVDRELADRLHHRWPAPKPFCLTPLTADAEGWRFELGVLDDPLIGPFGEALSPGTLRLGRSVLAVSATSTKRWWYEQLADEASNTSRWSLRFCSPTTFRARFGGAHRSWPLPVPYLVVRNLADRWERYASNVPLPEETVTVAAAELSLSGLTAGETRAHLIHAANASSSPGVVRGFTGQADFELVGEHRVSTASIRAIDALMNFVRITGVGDQTTKGMGWVCPTRTASPRA